MLCAEHKIGQRVCTDDAVTVAAIKLGFLSTRVQVPTQEQL